MSSGAFGKYEILERIAAGESTELFKSRLSGIGGFSRSLAIKRILPHRNRERGFVDAFASEARKAGLLSHANIVQILDLGQVEGAWFVAMEFIDGPNLGRVLERCREKGITLPVPHAVFICLEVLKALEYAHQRQVMRGSRAVSVPVVHHNLCPDKVLISQQGEVKLTDFANPRKSGHADYRAPEQPDTADLRSDLYAAGRILYEMLTGRLPTDEPPSPASHVNPDVPYPLDVVLAKALQRTPAKRYTSATEMKEALDRFFHDSGFIFSPSTLSAFLKGLFPDPRQRRPQPLAEQETQLLSRLRHDDDDLLLDLNTDDEEPVSEVNELPTRITQRPAEIAAAMASPPVLPPPPRGHAPRQTAPVRPPPASSMDDERRPYQDSLLSRSYLTQPIVEDSPEDETLIEQGVDVWSEAQTVIQRDPSRSLAPPPAEALELTRSTSIPPPPPPRVPPPPTVGPTISPRTRSAALSAAAPPPPSRAAAVAPAVSAPELGGETTASVSLPLPSPVGSPQRVLILLSALSVVAMVGTLFLGFFIGQRAATAPGRLTVQVPAGVSVTLDGRNPADGVLWVAPGAAHELRVEVQPEGPAAARSN